MFLFIVSEIIEKGWGEFFEIEMILRASIVFQ